MTLVGKKDFESGKFSLYFYAYLSPEEKATLPHDEVKAWDWIWTHRGAFVELTQYVTMNGESCMGREELGRERMKHEEEDRRCEEGSYCYSLFLMFTQQLGD